MKPSKDLQEIYPGNSSLWKAITASVLAVTTLVLSPLIVCSLVIFVPYNKIKKWLDARQPSDRFAAHETKSSDATEFTMTSQYVTMRDGTRIAIDLYLPTQGSTFSCVLNQSRYHRSMSLRWPWRLLANDGRPFNFINSRYFKRMVQEGFAVVVMDVRGAGASFGKLEHPWSLTERQDSADILDWITKQSWSNGRVGLWGISYEAVAAYKTASLNHPAVKACVPMFIFYDMYNDIAAPGGVPQHFFTNKWLELTRFLDDNAFSSLPSMKAFGWLFFQGVTPASGNYHDLQEAIASQKDNWETPVNPKLNRDTPAGGNVTPSDLSLVNVLNDIQTAEVSMLFYTGWYDQTVRSSFQGFTAMPSHSKVVVGPWNHGGVLFYNPDTQFSKPTDCDHVEPILEFFHRHLDVSPTGTTAVAPEKGGVDYFMLGENRWHSSQAWPPTNVVRNVFYLSMEDRKLVTNSSNVQGGHHTWQSSSQQALGGVSRWQSTIEVFNPIKYTRWNKANHIIFATEPLDTPLKMVGTPVVTLWLTSTEPIAADIFIYLTVLTPSTGHVAYVTEGHFRASHAHEVDDSSDKLLPHVADPSVPRHSFLTADQRPVSANDPTRVRFGVLPIAYRVPPGSVLELRVVGHDSAHFVDVVPTRSMTLAATALHASSLSLPVVVDIA
ncbi:unnamed protein product [Aphanomyces euteiches]|uniref:Xaa-Pro dipeptidyl-peptidase C-terminal domain-containing protein n=1 Tax=Aphanomyces euteiches TaxID=100861 RepID=A0A6G0X515_9STRA|nr:hypothetical protein Ae201684_008551 [Aphanomyces euteiches]KAH9085591.1 hypothetical protein Ae201684P_005297 [Aphanomyces euteiches]KAH9154350.1 hypothetical protein AeRB84_003539 [Aphanomyces euteiches]